MARGESAGLTGAVTPPGRTSRDVRRAVRITAAAAVVLVGCQFFPTIPYGDTRPLPPAVDLRGNTLALVPTTVPEDLPLLEERVFALDSLLERTLDSAGYTVISASVYAALWDSLTRDAGGFFDPYTGRRLEARYDSAVAVLFRELQARHDPQALLYPELWVTEAALQSGTAAWDGYREEVDVRSAGDIILGLTLGITVETVGGHEVFHHATGVEVVERWDAAQAGFVRLAPDVLLLPSSTDPAVARVLEPLVARGAASGAPAPR